VDSKPVPTYRFGDFTPHELLLIGMGLVREAEHERDQAHNFRAGCLPACGDEAMRRGQELMNLYGECKAAHTQAIKDGENNDGTYYG